MEEKDKFFIKNCKIKLKDSVLLVLNSNDDYENNFNQLKTYYMFLIKSKTISNNNKIIFFQTFLETGQEYLRQKLLTFLIDAILKIYQKGANPDLLVKNDYFLFKFLSTKETFKSLLYRYSDLISFNLSMFSKHIYNLPETKTIIKNENIVFDATDSFVKHIEHNYDNNFDLDNKNDIFMSFFEMKKQVLEKQEDKYLDSINNQYIFDINDQEEIFINDSFKEFVKIFMGLKITNKPLKLETNNKELIRKELEEVILLWPF